MKKAQLVVITIISIIVAVFATYVLSKDYEHFSSKLNVNYSQFEGEYLTAYFDVGYGFRQSLRGFAALDGAKPASIALPQQTVQQIRLDLDAKENVKQSIVIDSLCFSRKGQQHCWSAEELYQSFIPMNAIEQRSLVDDKLRVQASGFDPHFTFQLDFSQAHSKVSGISTVQYVLFAVLLAIGLYCGLWFAWAFLLPALIHRFQQSRQQSFAVPTSSATAAVVLLSIILSGAWLIAFDAGALVSGLFVGGVVLIALLPSQKTVGINQFLSIRQQQFQLTGGRLTARRLGLMMLVGCVCLLPIAVVFLSTWVQEFPHLGDHEYHLWGNRVAYQAVKYNQSILLFALLAMVLGVLFGMLRLALGFVAILLVSTGVWHLFPEHIAADVQGIFSRYPGGARVLAAPFVHWSYVFQWADPLNTGRVVNVLSVPLWLFVLRPLLIGRWPSLSILPLILLLFWQAEIVYQFSSAYLDIWSVIFILLALEKLIVSQTDPERQDGYGYLKACLLLGVACAFKEPAIFIVPWFWFAGWSLQSFRGHTVRSLFSRVYFAGFVGFASVLPFLVYYSVRKAFGVSRYTVRGFDYFLTGEWFAEMGNRIGFHFGTTGVLLLCMIALLWLVVLVAPIWRAQRWMMCCILGALLSQIVLFNWDQGGVSFTGYFRFYLPALVLFFAPIMLISASRHLLLDKFSQVTMLLALLVFAGNSPSLLASVQQLDEPDSVRNFNEHYDAPIYLPIRSLVKTAEAAGVLEGEKRAIYVNHVTSWNQPAFVYSDLLVKYKLQMDEKILCGCSAEVPTVLAPFVHLSGLNQPLQNTPIDDIQDIPQHQAKYVRRWREVNEQKQMCLAELERSCQYTAKETLKDGTVIGVIGVGFKK